MAYNGFAIDEYLDAGAVTRQLDELIRGPVYGTMPGVLQMYEEEYFEKKCAGSKEKIAEAKQIIPGGVQHNLAFNYPFPIVTLAGSRLYTSAAYDEEMIDDVICRFDRVFASCGNVDRVKAIRRHKEK